MQPLVQRKAGRATASRLQSVIGSNVAQLFQSLIKSICYPENTRFKSRPTCWGCEHEDKARTVYEQLACKKHMDFSLSICGLVVHISYRFMRASPEAVIQCKCCGNGALEITCSCACRDTSLPEGIDDPTFFFQEGNEGLSFNVYHAYFFQVQAQLKRCNAQYCDFVA